MNIFSQKPAVYTLSLALLFLPGCKWADWIKEKLGKKSEASTFAPTKEIIIEETTTPSQTELPQALVAQSIITIDGKTALSVNEFDQYMQIITQAHPEINQMIPFMPEEQQLEILTKISEGALAEQLISKEVDRQGLNKTAEYKEQAQQAHEMLDRQLANLAFQNKVAKSIVINDEEAKKYYQNNTNNPLFSRPPFKISQGGVRTQGIAVSSAKEAQELRDQARKGTSFEQLAQKAQSTVTSFGIVNNQSTDVDGAIRKKAQEIKSFPAFEVIKGNNNKEWVVEFTEKIDAEMAPYETVADKVKEIMISQKFQEVLTQEIEKLKASYKGTINKELIKQYLKEKYPSKNFNLADLTDNIDMMQETN